MVSIQVIGLDTAVAMAGQEGDFQLNAFRSIIINNVLHSIRIISDMSDHFRSYMVEGAVLNEAQITTNIERSVMMVTALSPHIGYDEASRIAHLAIDEDLTLREAALRSDKVTDELFDRVVIPEELTHPDRDGPLDRVPIGSLPVCVRSSRWGAHVIRPRRLVLMCLLATWSRWCSYRLAPPLPAPPPCVPRERRSRASTSPSSTARSTGPRSWARASSSPTSKRRKAYGCRDQKFTSNFAAAKAAGLKVARTTCSGPSPMRRRRPTSSWTRCRRSTSRAGDLIPVIDVEVSDGASPVGVSMRASDMAAIVETAVGVKPMIYTAPGAFWSSLVSTSGFASNPLWIAHYGTACPSVPSPWTSWDYWQYSQSGAVDGVTGAGWISIGSTARRCPRSRARHRSSTGRHRLRSRCRASPTRTSSRPRVRPRPRSQRPASRAARAPPRRRDRHVERVADDSRNVLLHGEGGQRPGLRGHDRGHDHGPGTTAGRRFHGIVPTRILDSRGALGGWNGQRLDAVAQRSLTVTGQPAGIPATASAVVMNVTATDSTIASFVGVWPAGTQRPTASNVNFAAGQTVPNLVTARVGTNGQVVFGNAHGDAHVVADVVGYFDDGTGPGELYNGITPQRILDRARPTVAGPPFEPGTGGIRTLQVAGRGGVPVGATTAIPKRDRHRQHRRLVPPGVADRVHAADLLEPELRRGSDGAEPRHGQARSRRIRVVLQQRRRHPRRGRCCGLLRCNRERVLHAPGPIRAARLRVANGLSGRWVGGDTRALEVTGRNGIPTSATGVVLNTTATKGARTASSPSSPKVRRSRRRRT